ncbi:MULTISPECIES: hypothetical protein [Flavobacterium]|uniref:YD repeat-containing protein n=1 Tax=Flavobacterium hankyongi TaxID=1176532 RepID=A0ABP9ACN0_9FLAO|nr:hypothetical protein [Flavobacterium sp. N1846]
MKNRFLITTLLLLKFTFLLSQNGKDNYFPPAPEASSLIKYVDIPVNYSTGVTNYSIPVHNIKLKGLNIPITLSHQSSGFKPSEVASNVGLGWELNVGGKIVQNVVGQNDIDVPGPGNVFWNLPNNRDFKIPKEVPAEGASLSLINQQYMDSINAAGTDYFMFTQIEQNNIDLQPDTFYYSTPTKSGKFFFANNFEAKQIPFGKEKIIYNAANHSFEITDTDGVRYLYSIRTENINFTTNVCYANDRLAGNSMNNSYTYYLTQIITPNNETVEFIYDTIKYKLINDKDYTRYFHSFLGGAEKITSYYSEITSKVLNKIIVNQNYEVDFLYNKYRKDLKGYAQVNAPKTLDEIKIKYGNEIESYHFNYGYFGINESVYNPTVFEGIAVNEDTTYRLKLKSFQKTGENPYIFSYYNEAATEKYTSCLDHWGYYSHSCGRYTMNFLFGDFNNNLKEPNLERSKTNILKSIILPTKGEVEFDYELNTCSDCAITYPEYTWETYSVYSNANDNFSNDWESHEVIFTVPENFESIPIVQFNLFDGGELTTTNYASVSLYDDQNHLVNFQAIGIGNQTKPLDGGLLQNGKTYKLVLECVDNMENENKYIGFGFLKRTDIHIANPFVGGLRIKDIKTKDNSNLISLRSFEYLSDNNQSSGILYEKPSYFDEYSYFVPLNTDYSNSLSAGAQHFAVQHSRLPIDLFGFGGYHIFYQKVTEKNNDINNLSNNIKVEKYFSFQDDLRYGEQSYFSKISYDWKRGLLSQVNEFNQNNIIRKTQFFYRFLDTPSTSVPSLEPGNHLSNPTFPNEFHQRSLAILSWRRNPASWNIYGYNSSKLISAWYYMDKKTTEENLNGTILKTEENYKYDNPTSAQLTSQIFKSSTGEIVETKYQYAHEANNLAMINRNMIGIPLITETFRNNEKLSTQVTTYKDWGNNLLAPEIIKTSKANQNLEDRIKYNLVDTNGNPLEVQQVDGIKIVYIWGYNKTLPIAKIENASYADVQSYVSNLQSKSNTGTENELIEDLNNLRNALPNAMVTTYTYKPLVGVSTITDPKGNQTTYDYDSFNRLKYIKDHQGNIIKEHNYNYRPN